MLRALVLRAQAAGRPRALTFGAPDHAVVQELRQLDDAALGAGRVVVDSDALVGLRAGLWWVFDHRDQWWPKGLELATHAYP